eukprot:14951473-Alexandrium_andersonii.AAC.1
MAWGAPLSGRGKQVARVGRSAPIGASSAGLSGRGAACLRPAQGYVADGHTGRARPAGERRAARARREGRRGAQ